MPPDSLEGVLCMLGPQAVFTTLLNYFSGDHTESLTAAGLCTISTHPHVQKLVSVMAETGGKG